MYSAILITYADGGKHGYVTPTEHAIYDGIHDGVVNEKTGYKSECKDFVKLSDAVICVDDFLEEEEDES